MAYPRQLKLDEETLERLKSYLNTELYNHQAERTDMVQDIKNWQRDYYVKPAVEKRTFPFSGASNIIIPLTAIALEAVHARSMTTMFSTEPFVSVHSNAGPQVEQQLGFDLVKAEQPLENYLHWELIHRMKVRPVIDSLLLEQEKFGTGIGKSGYKRITRKAVRTIGDVEQEFMVVTDEGATMDAVPNSNFLMRFQETDPQEAAWVGEMHKWTPNTIKMNEATEELGVTGLFYKGTFEKLQPWITNSASGGDAFDSNDATANQEELENKEVVFPEYVYAAELQLAFDVDGDDILEEIVVHYHYESGCLMSARYNWTEDLRRQYRLAPYIPIEHRWAGIGVCKQNDQFQKEVTTIHRQRLDNATLANMRMFKVDKLAGYGPREPVFPGKMWFLDDMDQIDSMQVSEVYPSSFSNEQAAVLYSQQRTGVNEVTLGMPNAGTPGTATEGLARLQEGQKKFDYTFGNSKRLVDELVGDTFCNIAQFGSKNVDWIQTNEGGDIVAAVLNLAPRLLKSGILFDISSAGRQSNRLQDRQNWTQVAALLNQYFMIQMQLAQTMGDPQYMQMVMQTALASSTEAMRQILETFDTRNIDRLVVTIPQGGGSAGPQQLSGGGGSNGPQGNGGSSGLDSILQALQGAGQG